MYAKSLAKVSGLQEMYTTVFGDIFIREERNFSSLPALGGAINTTSGFSLSSAIASINSPASP